MSSFDLLCRLTCPICDKKLKGRTVAELPHLPFCSARCKQIDLGRWLGEAYRVPAADQDGSPEDDEPEVP